MAQGHVQSIDRAIDIMMVLAEGPLTLTEVARATGLTKGTAFRILSTLAYTHMVIRGPDGSLYMLGPGVLRLTSGAIAGVGSFMGVAREPLTELWCQVGETVCVHIRVGMDRVCVQELAATSPVRYVAGVGAVVPLPVGAASKILLAFAEPADLERVLASLRESGIVDVDELRRELESVSIQGWTESVGERIAGAAAISVTIRGPGRFLASLSVLGPADRFSRARRHEILPLILETAEHVDSLFNATTARSEITLAEKEARES
jgi:IclR family KDG regulon transcriptional repressor